jgi:hypothetical protein
MDEEENKPKKKSFNWLDKYKPKDFKLNPVEAMIQSGTLNQL